MVTSRLLDLYHSRRLVQDAFYNDRVQSYMVALLRLGVFDKEKLQLEEWVAQESVYERVWVCRYVHVVILLLTRSDDQSIKNLLISSA